MDPAVGNVPANTRLGIPALRLEDGPQGVGDWLTDVTAFPSALTVAASWDVDLMRQFGSAMAVEQRFVRPAAASAMPGPCWR